MKEKCIHIYCGDGKGKTSAASGLALRMAGRGGKVLIARFLKNDNSGELKSLSYVPHIDIMPVEMTFGFYFNMTEEEKIRAREYYSTLLIKTVEKSAGYDLVILDEIMAVYNFGLINPEMLVEFLEKKPCEIVLTGRNPDEKLISYADYVSEIKKIKHPYDKGVKAREGIEY